MVNKPTPKAIEVARKVLENLIYSYDDEHFYELTKEEAIMRMTWDLENAHIHSKNEQTRRENYFHWLNLIWHNCPMARGFMPNFPVHPMYTTKDFPKELQEDLK